MVRRFNPKFHFLKDNVPYLRSDFRNLRAMSLARLCRLAAIAGIDVDAMAGRDRDRIRRLVNTWLPAAVAQDPNLPIVGRNDTVPARTMGTRAHPLPPNPAPQQLAQPQQQPPPQPAPAAPHAAAAPVAAPAPAQPSVSAPVASQRTTTPAHPPTPYSPSSPPTNQPEASGSTPSGGVQAGPGPSTIANLKRGRGEDDDEAEEDRRMRQRLSSPRVTSQPMTTPAQPPTPSTPVLQSNQPEATGSTSSGGAQAGPAPSTIASLKRGREEEDDEAQEGRRMRPRRSSPPATLRAQSRRPLSRSPPREAGPSTMAWGTIVQRDEGHFESEDGSSRPPYPRAGPVRTQPSPSALSPYVTPEPESAPLTGDYVDPFDIYRTPVEPRRFHNRWLELTGPDVGWDAQPRQAGEGSGAAQTTQTLIAPPGDGSSSGVGQRTSTPPSRGTERGDVGEGSSRGPRQRVPTPPTPPNRTPTPPTAPPRRLERGDVGEGSSSAPRQRSPVPSTHPARTPMPPTPPLRMSALPLGSGQEGHYSPPPAPRLAHRSLPGTASAPAPAPAPAPVLRPAPPRVLVPQAYAHFRSRSDDENDDENEEVEDILEEED